MTTAELQARRLAEVKNAALAAAPQADRAACAAALLVMVFDATIREHLRTTQPKLWEQMLAALGPLSGPSAAALDSAAL